MSFKGFLLTQYILETSHEGTKVVKNSILHMLITKFEAFKMGEDKSFNEFYAKLNDIVNSTFNLGEKIDETEMGRKVLIYFPI